MDSQIPNGPLTPLTRKEECPVPLNPPLSCPACSEPMDITELTCPRCQTRVQGHFSTPGLYRLSPEQLQFAEVFLRCRGNIREVEKDLKISYPTVRSRLDQVIIAMGYPAPQKGGEDEQEATTEVLDALSAGKLSFEEALERLKGERGKK